MKVNPDKKKSNHLHEMIYEKHIYRKHETLKEIRNGTAIFFSFFN